MSSEAKQLSERDAAILEIVQAATLARPVTIRGVKLILVERGFRGPDDRTIKGAIASLRLAGHPIGSSRGARDDAGKHTAPAGYYYCHTEREKREALRAYTAQVFTSLKLARAFSRGLKEDLHLQAAGEQLALLDI